MRLIAIAVVLLNASLARADEQEAAPAVPPEESAPPSSVPPAPIAIDSAAVEARFQAAVDAMIDRRFAESAALFDAVAAESVDPMRRDAALEMSRQARARATVTAAPPVERPREITPRAGNGRYGLLASTAVLGVGLYGPSLMVVGDSDDPKTSLGLYMLGAGGSFFGSYLATHDAAITPSMTDAWIHGATRGAWHGYNALALAGGESNDADLRATFGSLSLGSIAEGTGFALFARETAATTGLTNAMGKASDFGSLLALGLSATLVPDDADLTPRAVAGVSLLGAGLGYVAGYGYAQRRDVTWGDGEAMRASLMVGLSVASVPLVIAEAEDRRAIAGTLVVGASAALVVGDQLLRDRDFSAGQGIVMEVSTLAGGLVGAGLGYLISPDEESAMAKVVVTGAAIGTVAGFAIPFVGFDTRPRATGGVPASVQIVPTMSSEQRGVTILGTF
jgi:hypothetical protein